MYMYQGVVRLVGRQKINPDNEYLIIDFLKKCLAISFMVLIVC